MDFFPIAYNEPLFRPPAEANSLIFQVTLGCSWNKCAFCEMYTSKRFTVRKEKTVIQEIRDAALVFPDVRRIFLADGNALVLSTRRLLTILQTIRESFPRANRISAYALPGDIARKSPDELAALRDAGLRLLYVGIETGDDELLELIHKGETFQSTAAGLLSAKQAGIKLSVMILNGLGGKKYSEQHALNSAKILNIVQPEYASTLVLSFPFGEQQYRQRFAGEYLPMNLTDLLAEMELLIKNTELNSTIFRSNHASNFLILQGTLSKDKSRLLSEIRTAQDHPEAAHLRQEWERGL
ncbi:MAG: radical SAM protein [Candidatus Zhuqueibacterota bacterium]